MTSCIGGMSAVPRHTKQPALAKLVGIGVVNCRYLNLSGFASLETINQPAVVTIFNGAPDLTPYKIF